jgi:acyl carrier protein
VLADATLPNQNISRIRSVLAPKVNSARVWSNCTKLHPSTMHVVFSSVAALLGSPGQANYAAANAILDSMAESWQTQGSSGLSVQWGAWAEGGMAAANAATAKAVERMGMGMVEPIGGMGALQSMLMQVSTSTLPVYSAIPFKWNRFMGRMQGNVVPPMFSEFESYWSAPAVETTATTEAGISEPSLFAGSERASNSTSSIYAVGRRAGGLYKRGKKKVLATTAVGAAAGVAVAAIAAASTGPSAEAMSTQVHDAVKSVLGSSVGGDDPLMQAGLDSLGSVELKNALERRSGVELPSTLVFDYPTVNALSGFLAGKLTSSSAPAVVGEADEEYEEIKHTGGESMSLFADNDYYYSNDSAGPLAVIPGGFSGLWQPTGPHLVGVSSLCARSSGDALLQLLPADCPTPVPLDRWDVEAQAELCAGIPVQYGVFLPHVALFDAAAFSLSDTEAALMDPQQRMLLETVAEAGLPYSQLLADEELRADWGVFVVCIYISFLN